MKISGGKLEQCAESCHQERPRLRALLWIDAFQLSGFRFFFWVFAGAFQKAVLGGLRQDGRERSV